MMATATQKSTSKRLLPGTLHTIEEAEELLVKTSFRDALQLSNRILSRHNGNSPLYHRGNNALRTKIHFRHLNSDTFTIHVSTKSTIVPTEADRAAAVALQSWYELSLLSRNMQEGRRHLLPFLEFCSRESLSLNLVILLVKFCLVLDEYTLAVDLSSEVLHQINKNEFEMSQFNGAYSLVYELVAFLLIELLPRSVEAARNEIQRLSSLDWQPATTHYRDVAHAPQTKALEALLRSTTDDALESMQGKLREFVASSRTRWTLMLQEQAVSDDSATHMVPRQPRQVAFSLLARLRTIAAAYIQLIVRLREQGLQEGQQRQLAAAGVSLWIVWRSRKRLWRLLHQLVVQAIWRPTKEIVEALLPG